MDKGKKYTLNVEQDSNGELFLNFPDELLNQMGWDPGDVLLWEELPEGRWLLRKQENNE